jgi:uncharacterized protein (DUF2141 family)
MRVNLLRSVLIHVAWVGVLVLARTGFSEPLPQGEAANGVLKVKVIGARNAKGKIGVALFQDPTGFPTNSSAALRSQEADIDNQTMTAEVVFRDVPPGVYAVSALHDENVNGKLDKNFLGIPTEGYGASNNPGKKMRAPTFEEAKFSMTSTEQTLEIRLIY